MRLKHLALFMMVFSLTGSLVFGAGQQMKKTRVPADKLEEARALKNPLPDSPDILEKGKAIYEGKGTCVNCHGINGRGDGPGAANLNPPPRVFRSRGFWKHRTEGEIFWVIKYGSLGTGMIPFGGLLSDEEIWMVMQYEASFQGGHGDHQNSEGMGGHKGKHGHGPKKGHDGEKGHGSGGEGHQRKPHEDVLKKAAQAGTAAISMEQAVKIATEHVAGTAIEVEFGMEETQPYWEVEVVTQEAKVMEVKVNSESGEVIASEEKHSDEKQKHKRKRKGKDKMSGHKEEGKGCCSKGGHDEHEEHEEDEKHDERS